MAKDTIKDILNCVAEGPIDGLKAVSSAALDLSHTALDLLKENHYAIALAPAFPVGALVDIYRKTSGEAHLKELDLNDDKLDKMMGKRIPSDQAPTIHKDVTDRATQQESTKNLEPVDARAMAANNLDKLLVLTRLLPDGKYDAGMLKPFIDRMA
ncbi:MAG TPA: hypothetical protein PKZ32_10845, partial [Candidatus Melainabacteria bacterium]|nr:hypothetical protein [Candidatus Melainabacteria bacterium]